jgi:3-oxoacyl-[acyl-carrier-protein] synthase-3
LGKPVYIQATGAFFPNAPVNNEQIEQVLGVVGGVASRSRQAVLDSNQIRTRYYAIDPATREPTHTNTQLTAQAIRKLLADNPWIQLSKTDMLSCGTAVPDHLFPAHGQMVQGEFRELEAEVFTSSGVCCASMSAFKTAYLGIAAGEASTALVTGSEVASKFMRSEFFETEDQTRVAELKGNPLVAFEHDFLRWMLSDGAGALYLADRPGQGAVNLKINWIEGRSYANELPVCMMAGGHREQGGGIAPWTDLRLRVGVEGARVRKHAMSPSQDIQQLRKNIGVYALEKPLGYLRKKRGIRAEDYRWFLPHYSSHYFRAGMVDLLDRIGFGIPEDRWFTCLYDRGNVGSASMFVFLDELVRTKELHKGERILCFIPESARFSVYYCEIEVV